MTEVQPIQTAVNDIAADSVELRESFSVRLLEDDSVACPDDKVPVKCSQGTADGETIAHVHHGAVAHHGSGGACAHDHRYIAHWIERPALANEQIPELVKVTAPLRNPDISQEERQKCIQAYNDFQRGPIWAGWRDATVREIRELLEQRCG